MNGESAPTTLTPLQMLRPEGTSDCMEMTTVPSSTAIATLTAAAIIPTPSPFTVPEHWIVEDRRRISGKTAGVVDRFYREPETGLEFRSLRSIKRYLAQSEEKTPVLKMLGFDKKGKLLHQTKMKIVARSTTTRTSSFKLPDGWVIEECRRTKGDTAGRVDKFFIEPGTGRKFQSLISVERHLAEVDPLPTPKKSKSDNDVLLFRADRQEHHQKRDLAIVAHATSTCTTSNFQMPAGRIEKEVPSSFPNYDDNVPSISLSLPTPSP